MKKALILFSISSAVCLAGSWTGKLVDSTCAEQHKTYGLSSASGQNTKDIRACTPKESTTSFAIQTPDGQILKLDSTGNKLGVRHIQGQQQSQQGRNGHYDHRDHDR